MDTASSGNPPYLGMKATDSNSVLLTGPLRANRENIGKVPNPLKSARI